MSAASERARALLAGTTCGPVEWGICKVCGYDYRSEIGADEGHGENCPEDNRNRHAEHASRVLVAILAAEVEAGERNALAYLKGRQAGSGGPKQWLAIIAEVARLRAALEAARSGHDFPCAAAETCICGADEHNARIDDALAEKP